MKTRMSPALISWLAANPNCEKADLMAINLPTGQMLYVTSGQFDVTCVDGSGGLVNGGFEDSTTVPPSGWTIPSGVTASYVTSGQHNGTQSIKLVTTAAGVAAYQALTGPWVAGQTFTCSAWFKMISGFCAGILVEFLNHSGVLISSTGKSSASYSWSQINCSATIPAGTYTIQILIQTPNGAATFLADDVLTAGVSTGTVGWNGATTTFLSGTYGRWTRGAITSEASFDCKSNSMSLTCTPQPTTVYPGLSCGILAAALNGLFDASQVVVYTAYFPIGQYGTFAPGGIETKFVGTISKINDITRTKVEFDCADAMYLLGMKVPCRLFQANCPNQFGDSNCAPTGGIAAYTQAFTAAASSNSLTLTPVVAFPQAGGYFAQGVIKCTSGANVGLSQTVLSHVGGMLTMMNPWLLPVAVGDTFSVIKGCDRSMAACSGLKDCSGAAQNNLLHFMGTPFVPPPPAAIG